MPTTPLSNLDLVNRCDNFPYHSTHDASVSSAQFPVVFTASPSSETPIGLIRRVIYDALQADTSKDWYITPQCVSFAEHISTPEQRRDVMDRIVKEWKAINKFGLESGWRNELYPVYDRMQNTQKTHLSFVMERAATPLFGMYTFGVHLTIYTSDFRIYVPRRAATKQTFPSMLDNSVAGGITQGDGPRESLIRECMEEASLSPEQVKDVKCVGAVTYFYQSGEGEAADEGGWLQPETQITYDLLLPPGIQPRPLDGEVEQFYLWSVDEVKEHLAAGEFAPNCAIIMLDFFIRHGIITPENEPNFLEILSRIKRRLDFASPHYDELQIRPFIKSYTQNTAQN